ncbi:MAG: hypothetical protein ACREOK_06365 [Gemmatimonadaceae bacterium]
MTSLPLAVRAAVVCSMLSLLSTVARAQGGGSAVIDEGTFTITRSGAPVGRESFRIIRAPAPGGQVYQATGTSVIADVKATMRLGTDSIGSPVAYESEVSEASQLVQRLRGRGRPNRFGLFVQTRTGESAREFVVSNRVLLLDESVYHHFFFVGLAAHQGELIVISPRSAQQERMRLQSRGVEGVEIAGRTISGRRVSLVNGDGPREVWLDEQGRLLKVAIPDQGIVALRDDPPK